jgi:hypothetical protein
MWIRNVAEARFTGDLLVGLVTNLHEQQIRRRSKLCELGPHTIKVSILVEMDGEYSQWRVRGPAREPEKYARNGPPPTLFVSGKMPNKSMLIDYKPRGIYTSKFGIVR